MKIDIVKGQAIIVLLTSMRTGQIESLHEYNRIEVMSSTELGTAS